jgi:hypothetical protein
MKTPIAYLRLGALVGPLAVFTFLATYQTDQTTVSAAPGPAPVFVVNSGAGQAIPTAAQGITAISGTVSITGTPSVQVANDLSSPVLTRDVDRPTAQPFNFRTQLNFVPGFTAAQGGLDFTVPDGKRLVIEFATALAQVPGGQTVVFARVGVTNFGDHHLTMTHSGPANAGIPNGDQIFVGTHRMFAIAEPGESVRVTAFRNSGTDSGTVTMTVTGYLVDVT